MGIYLQGRDFYPAVITKRGNLFEAHFVDLPMCRASGVSRAAVEVRARTVLQSYVKVAEEFGRPLPRPTIVETGNRSGERYITFIHL